MADYHFVTTWKLRSPVEPVWDAIRESEKWPSWWKGVLGVEQLRAGHAEGVGSVRRYVWRSRLPYNLVFDMEVTGIEPTKRLEGRATGELEGTGVWELSDGAGVTTVVYTWTVRTTRRWMNLLAPVARPLFAWNHDWVMSNGARGLSQLLGAELVSGSA